jgi:ribosomal protein S18 acetylase RimI-like enzyme
MTHGATGLIRPYEPKDLEAVYRVCLLTGDSGADATRLYHDPKALGHLYAGPYVMLEPELAFVLEDESEVCGYVIGAADTVSFHRRMVESWLPPLQATLPDPKGEPDTWNRTERIYHQLHHPRLHFPALLESYPSHLHIDLLPRVQGRGFGRRLIERLFEELTERGSRGVHLGVGSSNVRARRFYGKVEFVELYRAGSGSEQAITMARTLP